MDASRTDLLAEIRSLADELGRGPFPDELEEQSEYSIESYRTEFGSWFAAISKAGLEKPSGKRIPEEELLAELRRLGAELEKTPSMQDMTRQGGYGSATYTNRFGSWTIALEASGFEPNADRKLRSTEDLINELQQLANKLGHPPTSREMDEKGAYSRVVYRNRFGSWNDALAAADLDQRTQGTKIPREDLLEEIRRLADELDRPPKSTEMEELGKFSQGVYNRRFGTWEEALQQLYR